MKNILTLALATICCLGKLSAAEIPQPTRAAGSWEELWRNELNEADVEARRGHFEKARDMYRHIANPANESVPAALRQEAADRLRSMRNEPQQNFLSNKEEQERKEQIKHSDRLLKKIDLADTKRKARNYVEAARLYQEVANEDNYPLASGKAYMRLAEMRSNGQIQ